MPNVRKHYLGMLDRLDGVLSRDPERGREKLRGILGERIKLQPDESGRFLWAEYSLGITACWPRHAKKASQGWGRPCTDIQMA
jgi:hypothetical protein